MIIARVTQRLLLVALLIAASGLSLSGQAPPPAIVALADTTIDQVGIAVEHTVLASLAAGPNDLQLQVRQVFNVLVGQDDPRYDRSTPNPGNGQGILKLAQQLADQLSGNDQAPDMAKVARRVVGYINLAIEHAQQALRVQRPEQVNNEVAQLLAFLSASRGSREDPLLEGGLRNLRAKLGSR